MPPASVKNPLARCDGSWLFSDNPTCTIPNASSMMPIARINPNMNSERLLTTVIGSSSAANAVVVIEKTNTSASNRYKYPFHLFRHFEFPPYHCYLTVL